MPGRFCYVCGVGEYKDGLCEEHFQEKDVKLKLPKRIDIEQCSKCRLVKIGNKQIEFDPQSFFEKETGEPVSIEEVQADGKNIIFDVSLGKETTRVRIHFDRKVCGNCGRELGGYYEGILQLRGNYPGEILTLIDNEMRERKHVKYAFYWLEKVKGGIDVYFGNKSIIKTLANTFRKKYNVRPKESFKLVTRKDGRDVKRRIICLRWE